MIASVVLLEEPVEPGDAGKLGAVLARAGLTLVCDRADVAPAAVVALIAGPPRRVGAAEADRYPRLRAVVTPSTGSDHLDVAALERRGIAVRRVADYCTDEVADHALALILALLRRLPDSDRAVRNGRWQDARPGRLIRGARLGVVGFGHIGRAVAQRALALGMTVLANDPRRAPAAFAEAGVARAASLDELLAAVDVLSLHVPSTPATRGMIGAAQLALMRPGAAVVNVARGDLVDAPALCAALTSGRLSGAGLDVFAVEPPSADDPLLSAPGTLLSPHVAWLSPDSASRALAAAADAVLDALGIAPVPPPTPATSGAT